MAWLKVGFRHSRPRERNSPPELILPSPTCPHRPHRRRFPLFRRRRHRRRFTLAKKSSHPFKLGLIEESRFFVLSLSLRDTQPPIAKKCAIHE